MRNKKALDIICYHESIFCLVLSALFFRRHRCWCCCWCTASLSTTQTMLSLSIITFLCRHHRRLTAKRRPCRYRRRRHGWTHFEFLCAIINQASEVNKFIRYGVYCHLSLSLRAEHFIDSIRYLCILQHEYKIIIIIINSILRFSIGL